jgi:Holliday junction DNA helicase RuvA
VIGSLRGYLLDRRVDGEVVVEVGGLGYRVTVAPATAVTIGEVGSEVFVWIHHHVRDGAEELYGFATRDERNCFEAMLLAHGVGPSLALAILSVHEPGELRRILADDDVAALCLVPGVGKKTATRLLVELKSRLEVPTGDGVPGSDVVPDADGGSARADVRVALSELGYAADEIAAALRAAPEVDDASVLLKEALQRLAVSRQP